MSRGRTSNTVKPSTGTHFRPWGEFVGVVLLALALLLIGGLASYQVGEGTLMGPAGRAIAAAFYAVFGMAAYLIALGIGGLAITALRGRELELKVMESVGFIAATAAGCVLLHVSFPEYRIEGATAGGLAGELIGELCLGLFDVVGTYVVAIATLVLGLIASTPLSGDHVVALLRWLARGARAVGLYAWGLVVGVIQAIRSPGAAAASAERPEPAEEAEEEDGEEEVDDEEVDEEGESDEEDEEGDEDEEDEADEEEGVVDGDESEEDGSVVIHPKRGRRSKVDAPSRGRGAPEIVGDPTNEAVAATTASKPRRNRRRAGAPEIVERSVAEAPTGAPTEASAEEVAEEAACAAPTRRGKRPPPRPEELAANGAVSPAAVSAPASVSAAVSAVVSAPGPTIAPRPEPPPVARTPSIPGIVRLTSGPYQLPPTKLFEAPHTDPVEVDKSFVLEQAERIEKALAQFKIRGQVTKIHPGPVITRYEFKPEPGVKLSKIESLENDLAMALEAIRIRILAPIPGKATVGFEVPNKIREMVTLKEILESDYFEAGRSAKLPLALGKNITGKAVSIDLAKAPHLLVAGATGSGKSVGVNSMISSLLYACTPEEVRMIMIDPKMLELSVYKDIPHLLLPVITDPEQANLALRWAVDEMERRYAVLSDAQVRDIGGYNKKLPQLLQEWEAERRALEEAADDARQAANEEGEEALAGSLLPGFAFDREGNQIDLFAGSAVVGEKPERMPYIVIIIDEFADLMMVASKEVEASVARIAAKARAAGIHLIVATQRPSVDVITGTIKNNFPSRIAFQVTSDIDSRTILDAKGAKQLLGMGDMLHMDRGGMPERVHGCFVSEDEILKVVEFIKKQARPVYNRSITAKRDEEGQIVEEDRRADPLYDKAVQIVAETRKVSTSMIQRRLNVGYNRAAKMVEMMEEEGVIGPARGTAPREVLVSAA
ncbi:MAG: DNA translocase FtsK 4TM domain-containing protein [Nannocystis sp.]|nr:DNA translocase FtsK 4TM domain-containing protein [Nannocystis sp.]